MAPKVYSQYKIIWGCFFHTFMALWIQGRGLSSLHILYLPQVPGRVRDHYFPPF